MDAQHNTTKTKRDTKDKTETETTATGLGLTTGPGVAATSGLVNLTDPGQSDATGPGKNTGPGSKKKNRPSRTKRATMARRLTGSDTDMVTEPQTPSRKRLAAETNTSPLDKRPPKKHKEVVDGLTMAQRTNPLTMVMVGVDYPEEVLTQGHLTKLRIAVRMQLEERPPLRFPRFEEVFTRGGAIVVIATDTDSKAWFLEHAEVIMARQG